MAYVSVRSKAVVLLLLLIYCLWLLESRVCSLFCYAVLSALSSFEIILMGKLYFILIVFLMSNSLTFSGLLSQFIRGIGKYSHNLSGIHPYTTKPDSVGPGISAMFSVDRL